MELGYFAMPSHPPECGLKEGHDWDLQVLRWLDDLGYQEAWIGEHHTAPWEPHPAPDLLVVEGFRQTRIDRVELRRIVGPVVGRRDHSAKHCGDVARLQPGQDIRQRGTGDLGIDALQGVVGAEFDDHGIRA